MKITLENIEISNEGFNSDAWVNIKLIPDVDGECNPHISELYFAIKTFYDQYLATKDV